MIEDRRGGLNPEQCEIAAQALGADPDAVKLAFDHEPELLGLFKQSPLALPLLRAILLPYNLDRFAELGGMLQAGGVQPQNLSQALGLLRRADA